MNNEIKCKLICGDNQVELSELPKESIELIYIDPPFFSNRNYEVVWGDEAEVRSFKDRWEGGIAHYISWLKPRVELMWDLLKSNGSLYLHCDWHANAHIRIMLDDIFGPKNFRNEIIWFYSQGGKSKKYFARKHDNIFYYGKSKESIFNGKAVACPLTPHKQSKTGRNFGGRMGVDESGREYVEKWGTGKKKLYRYYLDEGKIPEDVWTDIQSIQSGANERLGYPTQKPEALLERIIKASSIPGDTILDAFCGCGTACAVAHKLKRNWIGIDISPTAIDVTQRRLKLAEAHKGQDFIKTFNRPYRRRAQRRGRRGW